jgi:D-alanyl-D-alanine carboxypeptidase
MSVLVLALLTAAAVVLGGVYRLEFQAAELRARAQVAADSAALAAVAESGPYGRASPEEVARFYAGRNGAQLLECNCEPGANVMQVAVAVDTVRAEARAVIDPEELVPASIAFDSRGLHPRLERAVEILTASAGGRVHVTSGYRPPQRQAELWDAALKRYGDPEIADDWVARPGASMHTRGLAVDLGGDVELAVRIIDELDLPLYRPLRHEPWHFELIGSRS